MLCRIGATVLTVLGCMASLSAGKVEKPVPTPPAHSGIGRMIPAWDAKSTNGADVTLKGLLKGNKAVAVAFSSATCPVSLKYLPSLAKLEADFAKLGVGFVVIDPIATNDPESIQQKAKAAGLSCPTIHDANGTLSKTFGAKSTADLFILDAKATVIYRGAVDDQYGIGYSTDAPKFTYARDALTAVLNGVEPTVRSTTAPGCELDLAQAKPIATPLTYHSRISRLVQYNCLECHRTGGLAPFSLASRAELLAHKGMIKKVINDETMPPWHASQPDTDAAAPRLFRNDRSLPEADKADLLAWLAEGGSEGNADDAPLDRVFPDEWKIGKPDIIIELEEPVDVKATGVMEYVIRYVDPGFKEDVWLQAAEVHPTAGDVVHHVLVFASPKPIFGLLEVPGEAERNGFFAAYVPGNTAQIMPEGFGRQFKKDWRFKFQLHYTPNGTVTKDRTKVGFKFCKKAPDYEVKIRPVAQMRIEIPPHESNHPEVAISGLPKGAMVTAFSPHMHLRGKACKYEVFSEDKQRTIFEVPHYDFNWQLRYELAEPFELKTDERIRFTAYYDNSSANPANPDPSKRVTWGDQTFEEMCLGFVEYYVPRGTPLPRRIGTPQLPPAKKK